MNFTQADAATLAIFSMVVGFVMGRIRWGL
jgi:hypothetical protein